MGATVEIKIINGNSSSPTISSPSSGFTFGRDDAIISTSSVPKPESIGTNYSYMKTLYLYVTSGGGSTSISNRKIRIENNPPTGVYMFYKNAGSSYIQATSVIFPDNTAANGYIPPGWEYLSTTFNIWDGTTSSAVNNQQNGFYVWVAIGLSNNYTGGAGSSVSLPNIVIQYDEL